MTTCVSRAPRLLCAFATSLWIFSNLELLSSTTNLQYSTMPLYIPIFAFNVWMQEALGSAITCSYFNAKNNESSLLWLITNWLLLFSSREEAQTLARTMSSLPFFSSKKACLAIVRNFCENVRYDYRIVDGKPCSHTFTKSMLNSSSNVHLYQTYPQTCCSQLQLSFWMLKLFSINPFNICCPI